MPTWRLRLCLKNSNEEQSFETTLRLQELGEVFQYSSEYPNKPESKTIFQLDELKLSFKYLASLTVTATSRGYYMYPQMKFAVKSQDTWSRIQGNIPLYLDDNGTIDISWGQGSLASWGNRFFEKADKTVTYILFGVEKTVANPDQGLFTTRCEEQDQPVVIEKLN